MKNLLQTLAEINAGAFQDECTEALAKLVGEVQKTGGKGRITLTLDIKAAKGNQTVTVDADVKTKLPVFDRPTEFFFIGKDRSLVRDHPDQTKLPLREVADFDTGEVRTVNA